MSTGAYRPLFDRPGWRYEGADIAPGPNVDVVLDDPYRWNLPDADYSYDLVISGQAFEHIQFFWLTWMEMVRVFKPGRADLPAGAGRAGPEHRHPVDCWRFYQDGIRALGEYGDVRVLEATTRRGNRLGRHHRRLPQAGRLAPGNRRDSLPAACAGRHTAAAPALDGG
jgi:hypothetical protein